jgi:hypothetical protein
MPGRKDAGVKTMMQPPFHNLRLGPFKASYHRSQVDASFCADLEAFITREMLPQVTIDYEKVDGALTALYDEDRNCGPHSAVKNLYRLKLEFRRGEEAEEADLQLKHLPESHAFIGRYKKPPYLWTHRRKARMEEIAESVDRLCTAIQEGEAPTPVCPACGATLRVIDTDSLFDVTCPSLCFAYNFHRDPQTREFIHGHRFFNDPP